MPSTTVRFSYATGLPGAAFSAGTLVGSWTPEGRFSDGAWSELAMTAVAEPDGCPGFEADVGLDDTGVGTEFSWGVQLTRPNGEVVWGIPTEVPEPDSSDQVRRFVLQPAAPEPQLEEYRLSAQRYSGARRWSDIARSAQLCFSVWAPNAADCSVVFGGASGYIADDGSGAEPGPLPMTRLASGLWEVVVPDPEALVGRRYMYRVVRDDGQTQWRTDMYSLEQCGAGDVDPQGAPYDGPVEQLDGTPSCSVVVDPRLVGGYPPSAEPPLTEGEFWADELDPDRPVPHRVEDLVIYELHVGALNPTTTAAGTFADALALLPYLSDLGVNAVELLPIFEFNGSRSWGYGSSHFLAVETSAGGRDALKAFVKACHQRGIAVLIDVVYNHYSDDSARAAWAYDSVAPSRNIYYWYEGQEADYREPDGGYLDNVSSGWAPRYWEEQVRSLFVSGATMLLDEFHVDGLRVDQTTSIHSYNALHADGSPVGAANVAGRKFLRQLCESAQLARPDAILIAEDHSGWPPVTQPAHSGGIGFHAAWYADFYHHLIGDKDEGPQYARLLDQAGVRQDGPLAMGAFASALAASGGNKVVYTESHDEAGNAEHSSRTILVAVDDAPLVGETRRYAEARCRWVAAMSLLSAGTPMFLMGEEVGAEKPFTYNRFYEDKEDLLGLRATTGAALFRYYADLIRFRLASSAMRSHHIEVLLADDASRVIAFRRWDNDEEFVIVASLANRAYDEPGYRVTAPALGGARWRECFNSDAADYGGDNVGNGGASLQASGGAIDLVVPANGVVVLARE